MSQRNGQTGSRSFRRSWDAGGLIALAAILLLAFLLRCIKLDVSLWSDEIRTYGRAAHGFRYAWTCTQVPLAYVLSCFGLCLGDGEALLRLPHVLAGVAGVAAAYLLGKDAGGKRVGLLAALGLAVSAYHVHWSQVARYYALLMLLGLLFFRTLERALTSNRPRDWFAYVLVCVAGTLTHHTFIPVVAAAGPGALVWLLGTRSVCGFGGRARRMAVLLLCTILGFAGFVANAPSTLSTATGLIAANSADGSPAFGQVSEPPRDRPPMRMPKSTHRLTPRVYYGEYFDEYFRGFTDTWKAGLLLGFLGVCGTIALWFRKPALAAPLTSTFLLLPVPFFVVDTNHFHAPYYYSMVVPISALFVAMGIGALAEHGSRVAVLPGALPRFLARRDGRTCRGTTASAVIELAGLALIAGMLALPVLRGLRHHYDTTPKRDWKRVACTVAQRMTQDDILVYRSPWDWGYINFRLGMGFYLERYASSTRSLSARRVWCGTDRDVVKLASANPNVALWVVEDSERGFALDVFGEPTTNLCPLGGFEGSTVDELPPGVNLVRPPEAFSGRRSAKLSNRRGDLSSNRVLELPIEPTVYAIRNAGFELWTDEAPLGWSVTGGGSDGVARGSEVHSGDFCVVFSAREEPAILSQGLDVEPAPGMEIMATMWGNAETPGGLSLAVEYMQNGDRRRLVGSHSGGGVWEQVACNGPIPADVEPGSIRCVVRLEAGSAGGEAVDDVQLAALNPLLDPRQRYTLSMQVKHLNVTPGLFSIFLDGKQEGGEPFVEALVHTPGMGKDWHSIAFPVIPGVHLPDKVQQLSVVVDLAPNVDGTLWLDNVQFEAKDHPTAFVQGVRVPHDEYLAAFAQTH